MQNYRKLRYKAKDMLRTIHLVYLGQQLIILEKKYCIYFMHSI